MSSYRSTFVSSPASDTLFLLGIPLFTLGGLLLLVHYGVVTLAAFVAFTAVYTGAHHLPGFLRAYGTREIFDSNRARLILAPILILSFVAFFEFRGLRGYIVVLWFFNWWHTAMQNYGLMRIYERKSLPPVSYSVKLDLISIIVWHFTASELLSDDMRFELSQHLYNLSVGNAMFVSSTLWILRWAGIAGSAILALLYIRNSIAQFRANATVALNKQIFLITTYGLYFYMFYYFTKDISTSVESFFHNTQYLFFAWVMQRRLAEKSGAVMQFNWFGSLFSIRGKLAAILVYGGAVVGWGYLMGGSIKPRIGTETLVPMFNVLYATSAFLHYYTDSFIWKARSREMSATLNLKGGGLEMSPRSYGFSMAELSAMILMPMVLFSAITNSQNPAHQTVRENAGLAAFSAELLADDRHWHSAAIAAADVGDFMGSSDPAKSIEWYRRAVSARTDYADAYQALGHAYTQEKKFAEASEAYEKAVALDPTFKGSFNNLGNVYSAMGQPVKARAAYEKAIALDPQFVEPHLNLGHTLRALRDFAGAKTAYEKALTLNPNAVDAIGGLAEIAAEQGNLAEAVQYFTKVVNLTPKDAATYLNLSHTLVAKGDFEEALKDLDTTIRLAPDQAAGYIGKAEVFLIQNKLDDAKAALEQAIQAEPDSSQAHAALGTTFLRMARPDDALKEFEEAVRLDPTQASAYFEIAKIWEKRGNRSLAIMYFNQAVRYGDNPDAKKRLQELMTIQRGSD